MLLKKILLLLIVLAAVFAGYSIYQLINKKIDPRQSTKNFAVYMLLNLASVFVIVFIFSFIIIHFKEFLFSK